VADYALLIKPSAQKELDALDEDDGFFPFH